VAVRGQGAFHSCIHAQFSHTTDAIPCVVPDSLTTGLIRPLSRRLPFSTHRSSSAGQSIQLQASSPLYEHSRVSNSPVASGQQGALARPNSKPPPIHSAPNCLFRTTRIRSECAARRIDLKVAPERARRSKYSVKVPFHYWDKRVGPAAAKADPCVSGPISPRVLTSTAPLAHSTQLLHTIEQYSNEFRYCTEARASRRIVAG
jgi:hypothetical protein